MSAGKLFQVTTKDVGAIFPHDMAVTLQCHRENMYLKYLLETPRNILDFLFS